MTKVRILIVEDERIISEDLRRRLERQGYNITDIVSTGKKAIESAETDIPDIILMDIFLKEEMDGIEAAALIKSKQDIPIIYLTAFADEHIVKRAKTTQPSGYLLKPFDDRELNATIDISLYKHRMDNKLRESRMWLSSTLKSIGDGVIATDSEGRVKFMNHVTQTLTGYSEEESIGKPLNKIFKLLKVDEMKADDNHIESSATKEKLMRICDFLLLTKEGRQVEVSGALLTRQEVEIPFEDSLAPIKVEGGKIAGSVMAFRDVSAKKRSEEALKQAYHELQQIFNTAGDPMRVLDNDFTILRSNEAFIQLVGKNREEVIGTKCFDLFKTSQCHTPDCCIKRMQNGKENFKSEVEYKDSTGKKYFCHVTSAILRDQKGQKIGIVQNIKDLTSRKLLEKEKLKMETQLRQTQKMEAIGTLAGGIAHDFNNILSAILGYSELAKATAPHDSKQLVNLEKIMAAGLRAKDLVQQILVFSRQSQVKRIPIQIHTLIKEAMKMIRASIPTTILIEKDIDPASGCVLADPTQIHQIIVNLCTNANHAMEELGGTLRVELKRTYLEENNRQYVKPGEYIELIVSDTGTGIAPDKIDKIFDPYYTTKPAGKGTGLGLAIIYGIITDWGGNITVESKLGKGTSFHVFFPRISGEEIPDSYKDEEIQGGNERILFIDDEVALNDMFKMMLEQLGYHVTAKCNSTEALKIFLDSPEQFDLVITDQTMPNLTGADLAKQMLEIRPDIPIILCTGYSNLVNEQSAKNIGIKEFAIKPLTKVTIAKLIRKTLDK